MYSRAFLHTATICAAVITRLVDSPASRRAASACSSLSGLYPARGRRPPHTHAYSTGSPIASASSNSHCGNSSGDRSVSGFLSSSIAGVHNTAFDALMSALSDDAAFDARPFKATQRPLALNRCDTQPDVRLSAADGMDDQKAKCVASAPPWRLLKG